MTLSATQPALVKCLPIETVTGGGNLDKSCKIVWNEYRRGIRGLGCPILKYGISGVVCTSWLVRLT